MTRLRTTGLAALATAIALLVAPAAPAAPIPTANPSTSYHDGACRGTEGVTVIVDGSPDDAPTNFGVIVRCALGTPSDGFDALQRAGIPYVEAGGFLSSMFGYPTSAQPNGWWMYFHDTGNEWESYTTGAAASRPLPGSVEGWRLDSDWNTMSTDGPRTSPAVAKPVAASVSAAQASVTGPHTATVTAKVAAGTAAQQVHVEYVNGSDDAAATRSASRTVTAGSTTDVSIPLTALTASTTFRWRVVATGDTGSVTSAWVTLATPRTAARLAVRTASAFVHQGTTSVVTVERLDAGEPVTLRLGDAVVGTGTADGDGDARVRITVPATAPAGTATLVADGVARDRTGTTNVTVTTAAKLAVRVARRGTSTLRVTVSGLAPFEPVVLRRGASVVLRGVATKQGTFTRLVFVTKRTLHATVSAAGSNAQRTGSAALAVPAKARATKR